MTNIDILSGFLGAGKTTLIKKLVQEAFAGEKLVLIENEFGEIGIDGGFLQDAGLEITEMNSGCICCSLVGDFSKALNEVLSRFQPDRILIEPSGVGKLSDVAEAVRGLGREDVALGFCITVADAARCTMYLKNFGEFYRDQVLSADLIVLSRTQTISPEKLEQCLTLLRELQPRAAIVTTPWDELNGRQIVAAAEQGADWQSALLADAQDDDDDDDHDHERCHHHHDEHEHGEDCDCGCHDHHHDHDHDHDHHHDHHHHHGEHDADEVFQSWGRETARRYTEAELAAMLEALNDEARFGAVLRAKGILMAEDGGWLHFDFVPGEQRVRRGGAEVTGRVCVIGAGLHEDAVSALFGGV